MLSPPFWLTLGGIFLILIALSSCSHAPMRDRCIWIAPLGEFRCRSKAGDSYSLKAPDAKNLVCYDPAEDAAFTKYCGDK